MWWRAERDGESRLLEFASKPLHGFLAAFVFIERQHHAFDLWDETRQPRCPCSSANQSDHDVGRKPCCKQGKTSKAAFDQNYPFGEASLWAGFDLAPGSTGLIEQSFVRVLIHLWFPLEQCAPDEPLTVALPLHIDKANEQSGNPFAYACGNSQNRFTTEKQPASQ